jgi:hypothetical protein
LIVDLFNEAGLKNVVETEIAGVLRCGTADVYWEVMTEVAAPFVAALSNADEPTQAAIKAEVFESVRKRFPTGRVDLSGSALIISGSK